MDSSIIFKQKNVHIHIETFAHCHTQTMQYNTKKNVYYADEESDN